MIWCAGLDPRQAGATHALLARHRYVNAGVPQGGQCALTSMHRYDQDMCLRRCSVQGGGNVQPLRCSAVVEMVLNPIRKRRTRQSIDEQLCGVSLGALHSE